MQDNMHYISVTFVATIGNMKEQDENHDTTIVLLGIPYCTSQSHTQGMEQSVCNKTSERNFIGICSGGQRDFIGAWCT